MMEIKRSNILLATAFITSNGTLAYAGRGFAQALSPKGDVVDVPAEAKAAMVVYDDGSATIVRRLTTTDLRLPNNPKGLAVRSIEFHSENNVILKTEKQNYGQGSYSAYAGVWRNLQDPNFREGRDFNCSIQISPSSFPVNSVIRSKVPDVQSPSGLYGYLHIDYGNYDGSTIRTPIVPRQVKSLAEYTTDIGWEKRGEGNSSILNEFWLSPSPTPKGRFKKIGEVGCFPRVAASTDWYMNNAAAAGSGRFVDPQDRAWQVSEASGSGGPFYMFAPADRADVQGVIHWKPMLNFCARQTRLPAMSGSTGKRSASSRIAAMTSSS